MAVHRTVKRVGGSLAVIVPRDVAEMMGVTEGSPVTLTLVGRQLVIEPADPHTTRELRDARSLPRVPNAKTRAALRDAQRGDLASVRDVPSLFEQLNADD